MIKNHTETNTDFTCVDGHMSESNRKLPDYKSRFLLIDLSSYWFNKLNFLDLTFVTVDVSLKNFRREN